MMKIKEAITVIKEKRKKEKRKELNEKDDR